MLQIITCFTLVTCVCVQISIGQTSFFKNDNVFPPITSGFDSNPSAPYLIGDSQSSALANKEDIQLPSPPSTTEVLQPSTDSFPTFGASPALSPSVSNQSPVEIFVTEFNSLAHSSNTLRDIFDQSEVSAEAFSKSMYDYAYAISINVSHSDPHYIASLVATPWKEGIDTFSLSELKNVYSRSVAKYLLAKGILNLSNASFLAEKYARTTEESAARNLAKDITETKFLSLEEGFSEFFKSFDLFNMDTIEDLGSSFTNEMKKLANK